MRPFPEEAFRRRIAPIAQWHFAPTQGAAMNLFNEGVERTQVHVVGNTVIDELRLALDSAPEEIQHVGETTSRTITLTLHRRENYGRGLDLVCGALLEAIESSAQLDVVCPVHPNPAVGQRIKRLLGGHPRVRLTDPMPYRSFVRLLQRSGARCHRFGRHTGGGALPWHSSARSSGSNGAPRGARLRWNTFGAPRQGCDRRRDHGGPRTPPASTAPVHYRVAFRRRSKRPAHR